MNSTQATHTPTPWSISENMINGEATKTTIWIDGMDGNAVFALPKMGGRTYEEQMNDAAFIVRAVNSHEEMLTTLKDVLFRLQDESLRGNFIDSPSKDISLEGQVEKAIAKAEGGK